MGLGIMCSRFSVLTRELNISAFVQLLIFHTSSKTHILTLYFLDSGSYAEGILDWLGFVQSDDYDWIHQSQIDWFLQESGTCDANTFEMFDPDLFLSIDQCDSEAVSPRHWKGSRRHLAASKRPNSPNDPEARKTKCTYVLPHSLVRESDDFLFAARY